MTWTQAIQKGRVRWVVWIAISTVLGSCFAAKGGDTPEFLLAATIGALIGVALGFGLGPAAEKGEVLISGLLAGTPLYFIGISGIVIVSTEANSLHSSDNLLVVGIFLFFGCMFSLAQGLKVRRQNARAHSQGA